MKPLKNNKKIKIKVSRVFALCTPHSVFRPGYHGYTFSHQSGGVGVRSLPESGDPDKSGESGDSGGLTFRISLALALCYFILVI